MLSSDLAIRIRGLSKSYTITHGSLRRPTFRELLTDSLRRPFGRREQQTFWALADLSFDVKKGEILGVIGRNGAGKSTLLKILSRITEPTAGRIEMFGRVGSLLEVGTGFHAELTGRENIYLNGAILGMKRPEIHKQFDAIVDFADVETFLDTPVKRYSSGMYVRLAFAVAAHLNPDILIVDEVLAVGDAEFQQKCVGKMQDVARDQGRTVLFVSHNMGAVQTLCGSAMLLDKGLVRYHGDVQSAIAAYSCFRPVAQARIVDHGISRSDCIKVHRVTVNGDEADTVALDDDDRSVHVAVDCELIRPQRVNIEVRLFDHVGRLLGMFSPGHLSGRTDRLSVGRSRLQASMRLPILNRGQYSATIDLTDPNVEVLWAGPDAVRLQISGYRLPTGQILENGSISGPILFEASPDPQEVCDI